MLFVLCVPSHAQTSFDQIRIFGYFQNSFSQQENENPQSTINSFSTDQFNLFFQTRLSNNWTSLINFEMINSFSGSNNWGAFNLEEAWVRYRRSAKFNLKLGLQIPIFNHLNEIKNKTPLLPYITRPFVYDASLSEIIAIDDFVPHQAFAQAYGFVPVGEFKLDYAVHVGNSPNISTNIEFLATDGSTLIFDKTTHKNLSGIDTTSTLSYGGRIGLRIGELKTGISTTYDRTNKYKYYFNIPDNDFGLLPRYRVGGDFLYDWKNFEVHYEFITVLLDDDNALFDFNKRFSYFTAGYHCTEKFYSYLSYWETEENFKPAGEIEYNARTLGTAYNYRERITFKMQVALVKFKSDGTIFQSPDFRISSLAASVHF